MDLLSDNIIDIRGLSFSRGSRAIFDNIDIQVPRGKVTAIMGPSGTGKTTLLKLIGVPQYRNRRAAISRAPSVMILVMT